MFISIVLSFTYCIHPNNAVRLMGDSASAGNGVAMQTIEIVYPLVVDTGCLSHTI